MGIGWGINQLQDDRLAENKSSPPEQLQPPGESAHLRFFLLRALINRLKT